MEIKGKFNTIKVFTKTVDEKTNEQLQTLADLEAFKDSNIRIMPDVHAGKGCTIGTTMTIVDKAVPNMVGVDIGCGMEVAQILEKELDLAKLDKFIYRNIPAGKNCRKKAHEFASQIDLNALKCKEHIDLKKAKLSIGTLGGGNHFIEVDKDDDGNYYLVIHSGSRHLGLEVANYYQKEAKKALEEKNKENAKQAIKELTEKGETNKIENKLFELKAESEEAIPNGMEYCEGKLLEDYLHDMKLVQEYAKINRKAMIEAIIKGLDLTVVDGFTCIHNYIDTENMILRKGSVSAQKGEKLLIPINMRDGALICIGKGNADWNYSAPHGAGRLYGRNKAKELFSVEEFKKTMQGIYSTSVSASTLDESPMAYKDMNEIIENIEPTAEIHKIIKPVYNFKAGG